MFAGTIAKRFATGKRQGLIQQLAPNDSGPPDIVVTSPRRFLSLRKLIRPNEAIDGMLEVIVTTQAVAKAKGLRFQLTTTPPTTPPRLLLSHHTFDTHNTRHLRNLGTTVLHFKAADVPGRTSFDPTGFSGWSTMARQTADTLPLDQIAQPEADRFFHAAHALATTQNLSKYAQSSNGTAPKGDYVFVALQTIGDLVQRKAYVPMLDMLDMVITHYAGSEVQVVVKRHPKCKSRAVTRALRNLSVTAGVHISDASIHTLLAGAKALFTVNSGVGAEAMVHGVPIYCFGASDYAAAAHQVQNAATLAKLTDPIHHKCEPATLRRFYSYYRNVYQVERATHLKARITAMIDDALKG